MTIKKLSLSSETLRVLSDDQTLDANGAGFSYNVGGYHFCQTRPISVCICTVGGTVTMV